MTVLQFGLSGRWSYRLLPDEGIASREDNVPELLDEWKETYRLAQEDVLLFVLIAKKDDFSIKAIDAIKGAVAMEENDPVKRGGAVIQLLREWLEKSGDDYGLRAVWIDGRP